MIFKPLNDIIVFILILITGVCLYIESYEYTHLSFSLFLLFLAITRKSINTKIFTFYLFLYYALPFLNISTYRGTISFDTLKLYTFANFAIMAPLLFTFGNKFFVNKQVV